MDRWTSTNQKILFAAVNLSLMHCIEHLQVLMNPFRVKNFQTNYNVVPYGDHGTERVKDNSLSMMEYSVVSPNMLFSIHKLFTLTFFLRSHQHTLFPV